ncbi:MAG: DUF6263 family protein, partial [Myxococcota bacterium]
MKLEMPPDLDPQIKQMMGSAEQNMKQMSSPLPAEAVGVGAKWELHQQMKQNGIELKQVTTFELIELNGDKGKLKASVRQKADPQSVSMPNGVNADLVSLNSSGEGIVNFDLSKLVPNSSIAIKNNTTMKVMGQEVTVDMDMNLIIKNQ